MDKRLLDEIDKMNEEGVVESQSPTVQKPEPSATATVGYANNNYNRLYENAMAMLATSAQPGREPSKYERIKKLISDIQGMLWKIEDYDSGYSASSEDKDLQDDVIRLYKAQIGKTLGRLNQIWATLSGENVPQAPVAPVVEPAAAVNTAVIENPGTGVVAYADGPLKLATDETLVSPQNIKYRIVEANDVKVLIEDENHKRFNIEYATALKWKKIDL